MKTGKKFKKIMSAAAYTLVTVLIVCTAYVLFLNLSGKPAFVFGYSAMWVKTPSMEPIIPQKSYILVKQAKAEDIKKGDIIVFYSDDPTLNNSLNTHEVMEIKKGQNGKIEFVTKGRNNQFNDSVTAKGEKVIGKYKKNLSAMTSFGRFLSTSGGITIMMFLILLITLASFLPSIKESIKTKSKKEKIDELVREEVEKLKSQESKDCDEE